MRELAEALAEALKLTPPCPWPPEAPEVRVIQEGSETEGVQEHREPVETVKPPAPPAAETLPELGVSEYVQGGGAETVRTIGVWLYQFADCGELTASTPA